MKKLTHKSHLFIALILAATLMLTGCMGASAFTAEDTLSESFTVTGETQVVADTFNGSITVVAGSADQVIAEVYRTAGGGSQSQAEQLLEQIDVTFEQTGSDIRVTARFDQITAVMVGAEIRLTVPAGTAVEATTSNGDIEVNGVCAAVDLDTSNGTIRLTGGAGDTRVNTSNGQIELEAVDADVTAETSNGAIRFSGSLAPGSHRFETSNGEVELHLAVDSEFALDAHTSNGNVDCGFTLASTTESEDNTLIAQVGSDTSVEVTIRSSNGTIRVNPLP